jgi:hypothetical protein
MQKFYEFEGRDDAYSIQRATWEVNPNLTIEDFRHALARNYRRTMRDFGAQPMGIIESFWGDPEFVEENVCETCKQCSVYQNRSINSDLYACRDYDDCHMNAYRGNGVWADWLMVDPIASCYTMHLDLSQNKDKMGFALSHDIGTIKLELDNFELYDKLEDKNRESIDDFDEDDRYMEKTLIKIDAIGWIDPASGLDDALLKNHEIRYQAVLDKIILPLKKRGIAITKITFDQFQSLSMRQKLEDLGYDVELLSLDRTDEYPVQAKRAFVENRVEYPYDKLFCAEAKKLKYVKGKKVDHPGSKGIGGGTKALGHSKDCWDAVAGTICNTELESLASGSFESLD